MKVGYHWAVESKYVSVPHQDQLNMKSGHREFLYINKTKIQCKETQFTNT